MDGIPGDREVARHIADIMGGEKKTECQFYQKIEGEEDSG